MIAYHGEHDLKRAVIARAQGHREADQIRQGNYWGDVEGDGVFRGCAVGCTVHSDRHADYESHLGIPEILAEVEDGIFENLGDRHFSWPVEFLEAIPVGADLSRVWLHLGAWLCAGCKEAVDLFARAARGEHVAVSEWYATEFDDDPLEVIFALRASAGHLGLANLAICADNSEKAADKLLELLRAAPVPDASEEPTLNPAAEQYRVEVMTEAGIPV